MLIFYCSSRRFLLATRGHNKKWGEEASWKNLPTPLIFSFRKQKKNVGYWFIIAVALLAGGGGPAGTSGASKMMELVTEKGPALMAEFNDLLGPASENTYWLKALRQSAEFGENGDGGVLRQNVSEVILRSYGSNFS